MAPNNQRPLRIVSEYQDRNGPTGGSGKFIAEDGSVWEKADSYELSGSMTAPPQIRYLRSGWLLP